jgi:hypothetical protein
MAAPLPPGSHRLTRQRFTYPRSTRKRVESKLRLALGTKCFRVLRRRFLPPSTADESIQARTFGGWPLNARDSSFSKSLLPLIALTLIYSVGLAVLASRGVSAPEGSSLFWKFALALFMVRWAAIDRRSRSFSVPFEFDAFVFFGWVVVVPYYLLRTRGPRGLISAIGFWALALTPTLASQVLLVTRGK